MKKSLYSLALSTTIINKFLTVNIIIKTIYPNDIFYFLHENSFTKILNLLVIITLIFSKLYRKKKEPITE
ncbi:hypothetical protein EDB96_3653 [Flavobacterium sp. S87F.05.LMB.W.Kidney.N]|nr:hypothetical protein EDB96_3653 [Flavobacterium sp. S87F.05.LMB.W.Kidney.N]